MLFKQYILATLMASASLVAAIPRPDVIDLSVRDAGDYGSVYDKRSPVEAFVCKRDSKYDVFFPQHTLSTNVLTPGNSQSLSCLKVREPAAEAAAAADQSKTANV